MDNGAAFHSEVLWKTFDRWNVRRYYRAAYRPSRNRIVERNHRNIKAIAERAGISPTEAVFWNNMSPKSGQLDKTVPQRAAVNYRRRHLKHAN